MVGKYKPKESYKHFYAKKVLSDWLSVNKTINMDGVEIDMNDTRVLLEYPICDETINNVPRIYPDVDYICVLDLLICKNNVPLCGFEVVHKHKSGKYKIKRLQEQKEKHNNKLMVYEVCAEWIMCQIKPQKKIKILKRLC